MRFNSEKPKFALEAVLFAGLFLLQGCYGPGYVRERGKWTYVEGGTLDARKQPPMSGVDAGSFHPLKIYGEYEYYAADIHHVYYNDKIVEGADPASFEHVSGVWWKDKSTVYYEGSPVTGSDPRTFVILIDYPICGEHLAADARHVYCDGNILKGADRATFVHLDTYSWSYVWKDKSAVYCHGRPIEGADARKFVVLKDFPWYKDARRAWWGETDPLKVHDPASFESINSDWARDSKAYYAGGTANTDVGEVIGADYPSFQILKYAYARDRNHVYWGTRAIKGADVASFRPDSELRARDRYRYYIFGLPVAKNEWETTSFR